MPAWIHTLIMKKSFALFLLLLPASFCFSQTGFQKKINPGGKKSVIAAGINIPLGDFSNTHYGGFSTVYAWSKNRFGRLNSMPAKKLGLPQTVALHITLAKKNLSELGPINIQLIFFYTHLPAPYIMRVRKYIFA